MSKSSRTSRTRRIMKVSLLTSLYIFGVILGCIIIAGYPLLKNRSDLILIAEEKANEILSAGMKDEVLLFGMEHILYNERGNLISLESEFLHESQREYIRSFVPKVLNAGQLFKPTILLLDSNRGKPRYVFGIIAATVVEGPGGHPFVSILLRDLPDVGPDMITYSALFTIMYLFALLFTFHAVREEQELHRMRRDLIANVSHELKTPITAIRAMAEVLHDGMAKDEKTRKMYSGKIIEESDQLEKLVLDILELSRLQSKHTEFKKEYIYADGLMPPVIDRYMMLCSDMNITLDTSGLHLEDVPKLYTDGEKIVDLMSILLDNAVKFAGKGGNIWISNQIGSKNTVFCIRDNGPGIQQEDLGRIFERFYKADTAHNSTGSGLGLAIADEIAGGLSEKLWVESSIGKGAAFYFTISY